MRRHNNAVMCASTQVPGSLFQPLRSILEIRTKQGPNFSWQRDPTLWANRDPERPKQGVPIRDPNTLVINQLLQLYIFLGLWEYPTLGFSLRESLIDRNWEYFRFQLDRISGLHVKVVHSSTLVLDKAPICTNDTLSPSQNGQNTPPKMGLNLILIAPLNQFLLIYLNNVNNVIHGQHCRSHRLGLACLCKDDTVQASQIMAGKKMIFRFWGT